MVKNYLDIINFKMNKKNAIICFFISFFFPFFFSFLHYNSINKIKKIAVNNLEILSISSDNSLYPYYIDKVEKNRKFLFIDGWITKKGEDNIRINRTVVIKDSSNNYYELFTKSTIRPEVTAKFNDNFDYNRTGFISRAKIGNSVKYPLKIYIFIKEEKRLIDTNIIIN